MLFLPSLFLNVIGVYFIFCSVLSGSSINSQISRASNKSLYKWSRKWTQQTPQPPSKAPNSQPTNSHTLVSPNTPESCKVTASSGTSNPQAISTAGRPTSPAPFTDEEDEDFWLDVISSQQVSVYDSCKRVRVALLGMLDRSRLIDMTRCYMRPSVGVKV